MTSSSNLITEELRVPIYHLPNVLACLDGSPVTNADQWKKRREEIFQLFEDQVYGRFPTQETPPAHVELVSPEQDVFQGKGTRQEVRLWFTKNGKSLPLDILLYLPKPTSQPIPMFIGLNFNGNHSVQQDPTLHIVDGWYRPGNIILHGNHQAAPARGSEANKWPVEHIIARGYGLATAYYGQLDPDFDDGFQNGLHPLFFSPGQTQPGPGEWGSIGAWAWGLSRILDFLETQEPIDSNRIAVFGHSRLGKTALWAGAVDQRFKLVISNNSGCGGAALSRRRFGETVQAINERFPHWFCKNFHRFNGKEDELPVDQHMLISLIAPRPVYIASAQDDLWADPKGEFLSAYHASPVFQLLGGEGLAAVDPPSIEQPIFSQVGYHIRRGVHDVTLYDWTCFMDFADRYL